MNKWIAVLLLAAVGACSESKYNYTFSARAGIPHVMTVRQNEAPTGEQVASMSEAAGRSRWHFCSLNKESSKEECVYGDAFTSEDVPSRSSCLFALSSINAMLKRETTADQKQVCQGSP